VESVKQARESLVF